MNPAESYLEKLARIEAEIPEEYAVDERTKLTWCVFNLMRAREQLAHVQDRIHKSAMKKADRSKNMQNIAGICQRLAMDMEWYADNEVFDEEGREEIVDIVVVALKRLREVDLDNPVGGL